MKKRDDFWLRFPKPEPRYCPVCFAEIPEEVLSAAEEANEERDEDEYTDMIWCPQCGSEILPITRDEFNGGSPNL